MKPDDIKTWEDLAALTVPRLRELAHADAGINDAIALNKEQLLDKLAPVYALVKPVHHKSINAKLKHDIKPLKAKRDAILAAPAEGRDYNALRRVRLQMKRLKREMRKPAPAAEAAAAPAAK